jgi:hypothetical protein
MRPSSLVGGVGGSGAEEGGASDARRCGFLLGRYRRRTAHLRVAHVQLDVEQRCERQVVQPDLHRG